MPLSTIYLSANDIANLAGDVSIFFSDVSSGCITAAILSAVVMSALTCHFLTPYPMTSQTVEI